MGPVLFLQNYYATATAPPALRPLPTTSTVLLDLHKTKITDSSDPEPKIAKLSSFIRGISANGELVLSTYALFGDGDHPNGKELDFKYDSENDIYGIGTAFLQDTPEPT
jgi:hypothetical protein